jgi:transposase
MRQGTAVGLDVHARSAWAATLDCVTGELCSGRVSPQVERVVEFARSLAPPVCVAYEAGPTGFGLARALEAAGIGCIVAAPSKLERAPGDRVKTDRRDAELLARRLRSDELVAVRVPSEDEEAARDLVRARGRPWRSDARPPSSLQAAAAPWAGLRGSGVDACA